MQRTTAAELNPPANTPFFGILLDTRSATLCDFELLLGAVALGQLGGDDV